ncbi:MAG: hypothetical protein IT463_14140, partial [Planctomycetes bacterium]|nr:hypothetical protein [Planctomycetota bacterium]
MRAWMAATLILCLAALGLGTTQAQETPPKALFDNAPVADVLLWARKELGVGFLYESGDLLDPATSQPRRVSAQPAALDTREAKQALLFELLRRAELVPFEVGGMPGPTYQLHTGAEAARHAPILQHPEELGTSLFAGLSIRLKRAAAASVAARVREVLTPGIGRAEVFEETQTLVVTDYADRLHAAWSVAQAAEQPGERADDLVVRDLPVSQGSAQRHAAALERLRAEGETWKVAVNEPSNVLLVNGRRDELDRVAERARKLQSQPENPAFAETTHTLKTVYITAGEAAQVLRDLFAVQVASGSVQVAAFERTRS